MSNTLTPEFAARLNRALTADESELFIIAQDPAMEVVRAMLRNRHLNEDHLLALLKRIDLTEELVRSVAQIDQAINDHRIKVALANNPNSPTSVVLSVLPHLHLFELLNICFLASATPDQKIAAERVIIQRLPMVPLGSKLTMARRGTAAIIGELLKSGEPEVFDLCLDSPRLQEISILQFLGGCNVTGDAISRILRHPKWRQNSNISLAIIKHPKTPHSWFTQCLPHLSTNDVKDLLLSTRISLAQKKLVERHLKVRGHSSSRHHHNQHS